MVVLAQDGKKAKQICDLNVPSMVSDLLIVVAHGFHGWRYVT